VDHGASLARIAAQRSGEARLALNRIGFNISRLTLSGLILGRSSLQRTQASGSTLPSGGSNQLICNLSRPELMEHLDQNRSNGSQVQSTAR